MTKEKECVEQVIFTLKLAAKQVDRFIMKIKSSKSSEERHEIKKEFNVFHKGYKELVDAIHSI